jgi:ribosome-associated protein
VVSERTSDEVVAQQLDASEDVPLVGPSRELALAIAEVIADTPAQNTLVLDIHRLSPVADCFVICSGENERQLRAIFRDILDQMDLNGVRPRRVEGTPPAGWILIDYGDVVVHIFDEDQRSFYRLEDLWSGATTLLAMQ